MGSNLSKHPDEIKAERASGAPAPSLAGGDDTGPPSTSSGGCPMKRDDGSYSFDWRALWRPDFPHRDGLPCGRDASATSAVGQVPQTAGSGDGGGGGGGCPVKARSQHPQYNVYSQPLDPSNQMPAVANQLPAPGQRRPLSTERVASSIPKGGGDGSGAAATTTWTYPSPQMFYNALARKGKLGDTSEDDIADVVALHNQMNEKTWRKVLQWEGVVQGGDDAQDPPKLLRFQGRPTDLSPKAFFKHYLLGHPLPYDRHDWTVVHEADGSTRRYVIDYYHDAARARTDAGSGRPDHRDDAATPSLLVDVRPALDDARAAWARWIAMPYARRVARSSAFEPLPLRPTVAMEAQVQESVQVWQSIQRAAAGKGSAGESPADASPHLTEIEARALAREFAQVMGDCRAAQQRVNTCKDELECARASMDLTVCMGKIVCPPQHAALSKALADSYDGDTKIEAALEVLSNCVTLKAVDHKSAKELYPKLFTKS